MENIKNKTNFIKSVKSDPHGDANLIINFISPKVKRVIQSEPKYRKKSRKLLEVQISFSKFYRYYFAHRDC